MTAKNNHVGSVVADRLCLGCGTCVSVCPSQAIRMEETPGGLLEARVSEEKCTGCGRCTDVCPGVRVGEGLIPEGVDPFKGRVVSAYYGRAVDDGVLRGGQSGGVATALVSHLLAAGHIRAAMVTCMPEDGSLRPQCVVTSDPEEVRKAQGSQYCPVSLNAALPELVPRGLDGLGVVGLPCHFHGMHNLSVMCPEARGPLRIGLICGGIMSYAAIDYLIRRSTAAREDVSVMRYRNTSVSGWPGDVGVKLRAGDTCVVSRRHRFWCKGVFTPARCYLCFDKMNIGADIVLGDAWGVREVKEGRSVVLCRTERGRTLIEDAEAKGALRLSPVEPDLVFKGQKMERQRQEWTAFTRVWAGMGRRVPSFGIEGKWEDALSGMELEAYAERLGKASRLHRAVSMEQLVRRSRWEFLVSRIQGRLARMFGRTQRKTLAVHE